MSYTPKGDTREKILAFVRKHILAGNPPTVREVQAAFGFRAVETARRHLENLIAEGRLGRETGRARGYRLPAAQGLVQVPLLGRVQAGALTTAVEEPEGYLPMSSRQARGELFALHVRGESMTGAGILPGDIAVVRRQSAVDSGDIAVALVGDEATVKRVRLRRGRLELHAENSAFPPIIPRPGETVILGKVIEIRRHLE
jgi:repressor LexA